jgi:hypothetical protein
MKMTELIWRKRSRPAARDAASAKTGTYCSLREFVADVLPYATSARIASLHVDSACVNIRKDAWNITCITKEITGNGIWSEIIFHTENYDTIAVPTDSKNVSIMFSVREGANTYMYTVLLYKGE